MQLADSGTFTYANPRTVHWGPGSLARCLALELDERRAQRAFVITTRSVAANPALGGRLAALLGARCVGQFAAITQHAPAAAVAAAVTLIPFMMIVIQYTVDAERAGDLKTRFGIDISGPGGGKWCVDVERTAVSIAEGATEGCPTVFSFTPNEFVLSTYQRMRGGAVSGDAAIGERIRDLLFKI